MKRSKQGSLMVFLASVVAAMYIWRERGGRASVGALLTMVLGPLGPVAAWFAPVEEVEQAVDQATEQVRSWM